MDSLRNDDDRKTLAKKTSGTNETYYIKKKVRFSLGATFSCKIELIFKIKLLARSGLNVLNCSANSIRKSKIFIAQI